MKGLGREYILRTFGVELADKVFPQYKEENRQGTSKKSDYITGELSAAVLGMIEKQGYIFERDVNVCRQWKRSIQEILDSYGLERVRLNKELKREYGIDCSGYPYIIIRSTDE
jgi:hypothetical protein